MAQFYGSVDNPPEQAWEPVPGQLCGVWHTQEQIWLRGQVKELGNSDMLYIKYLDYGDTVHLPRSYTRKLRWVNTPAVFRKFRHIFILNSILTVAVLWHYRDCSSLPYRVRHTAHP